jgi:hypothetical protein
LFKRERFRADEQNQDSHVGIVRQAPQTCLLQTIKEEKRRIALKTSKTIWSSPLALESKAKQATASRDLDHSNCVDLSIFSNLPADFGAGIEAMRVFEIRNLQTNGHASGCWTVNRQHNHATPTVREKN